MHIYIYINLYIYIHINLPVNVIVRPAHSWRRDSQCQETFLAPSSDKCSNHHPFLLNLRSKRLSRSILLSR